LGQHLVPPGELGGGGARADAQRRKYDVVWLGPFEALWKALDDEMAEGLAQAIREGVSFIHTGSESSFRGGDCRKHGSKEGRLRPLGFSREARMALSAARGSTLHCKPDSQLRSAGNRSRL
jgi:hypothetical protein